MTQCVTNTTSRRWETCTNAAEWTGEVCCEKGHAEEVTLCGRCVGELVKPDITYCALCKEKDETPIVAIDLVKITGE